MDVRMGRRALLRAGSGLGLLWLAGCADRMSNAAKPDSPTPSLPEGDPPNHAPVDADSSTLVFETRLPVIDGLLPRSRWTTAPLNTTKLQPMNGVAMVTVSHDGLNAFTGATERETIERLQRIRTNAMMRVAKDGQRFADIRHHFIVDRAGRVWEGRPLQYQGAHVQDHNEHNVGVLCLGNFMLQHPAKAQTERLDKVLAQIAEAYSLKLSGIKTHRELKLTENPGQNLQVYMDKTRMKGGGLYEMMAERGLA